MKWSRFFVVTANALGVTAILASIWFPFTDLATRVFISISAVLIGFCGVFNHYTSETYLAWWREAKDSRRTQAINALDENKWPGSSRR
jgi:hypothetical protein